MNRYSLSLLVVIITATTTHAQTWVEQIIPTPAEVNVGSLFGWSVALQDDLLLVGAPGCDADVPGGGAAFLFKRDQGGAGQWDFLLRLQPTSLAVGSAFGSHVLFQDDRIFIGAPADEVNGIRCGTIHVFGRSEDDANNWVLLYRLGAPFPHDGEGFGSDFNINGRLVVNMPRFFVDVVNNSIPAFALYVFNSDAEPELYCLYTYSYSPLGPACSFNEHLLVRGFLSDLDAYDQIEATEPGDFWGSNSVQFPVQSWLTAAVSDARMAMTTTLGQVAIFAADGDTLAPAGTYVPDMLLYGPTQRFGHALDWHEASLAVGAPGAAQGPPLGRVHVVVQDTVGTGDWIDQLEIVPSDPEYGALFGHAIDLGPDLIAVGAPGQGVDDHGQVYLFHDPVAGFAQSAPFSDRPRVWPVPASDRVSVSLPFEMPLPATVAINNLTGACLRSFTVGEAYFSMDTRSFVPGSYQIAVKPEVGNAVPVVAKFQIARP